MLDGRADVVGVVRAGTVHGPEARAGTRARLTIILLVIAALCFLGTAIGAKSRISLVAVGLLARVLPVLIAQLGWRNSGARLAGVSARAGSARMHLERRRCRSATRRPRGASTDPVGFI